MKRVLTALVAIPIVVLIVRFSPDWLFAFAISLVSVLAVEEFLSLAETKGLGRPGRWFLVPAALVAIAFLGGANWVLAALVASVIALTTVSILEKPIETALGRVGMGLSGLLYCCVTLGFLILMARNMPRNLILLLLVIVWIGDTAAYYCGRAFGRHLLAPNVSPKKTVEGALAGFAGSVVAGTISGVWLLGEPWLNLAFISGATAIAGQFGDLAESVLKRSAGVKDSSSILPGHGGILDRLDSLIFAVPIFYWLFNA